jgi:hypothetical protein
MQARIGRTISAMVPFLIWINDANSTADHVILDGDRLGDSPSVAFIDHAGGMQRGPKWGDLLASDCFMPKAEYRNRQVIATVTERIHKLTNENIDALVSRIPDGYFLDDERQYTLCNLLRRKANLHGLIEGNAAHWVWWP